MLITIDGHVGGSLHCPLFLFMFEIFYNKKLKKQKQKTELLSHERRLG